jgi:glycosyltransferase involved in cell wall biosynthesis
MKILVTMNSFQQGGAEASAIKLAEGLSKDGNQVEIYSWNNTRDFFSTPVGVNRVYPSEGFANVVNAANALPDGLSNRFIASLHLLAFRRMATKSKYDVVIAFESNIGTVVAVSLISTGIPVLVSERISPDPKVHKPSKYAEKLRPWIYKKGAVCSVQSQSVYDWVKNNWNIQAVVTPNHLGAKWFEDSVMESTKRDRTIVALGRFDAQKDYETLLLAWSKIQKELPTWKLKIYGRGEITNLYYKMNSLEISQVQFYPPETDVAILLSRAGIFVSSSRYEGFPNVVLEALARMTPTVATRSCDVVNNFERNNGLIAVEVGATNELANAIFFAATNTEIRERLAISGYEVAKEYTWEKISSNWYSAIDLAKSKKGVRLLKNR